MIILKDNRKYCFAMEMSVRDYELDCESIVNNANYLHYMEHTRHSFCAEAGMSFVKLHEAGVDVVVRKFVSCLRLERRGPRFVFHQDILKSNGEISAQGIVTVVVLKNGKLSRGDELARIFQKYIH